MQLVGFGKLVILMPIGVDVSVNDCCLLSCDKLVTYPVVAGIEFSPSHGPDMDKWKRVNGWIKNSYKLPAESQICCMIKQFFSQTFLFLK